MSSILVGAVRLCTLAAYAFARFDFAGREVAFALVLVQLMIMPEVLIVENYRTMSGSAWWTRSSASACPTWPAPSASSCCARPSRPCPRSWRRRPGSRAAGLLQVLWKVYVPLAKPTYLAYGLVSVSYHWNNFLWPLVITNSVETRPLTVGLAIFAAPESGVDWSIITAGTLLAVAPLLIAFLLFQRQFVQSFMHAGIK